MKVRDALDIGASAATVVGFVVGVVALAWSAVNDKLALGLGVALVASVILNVVLLVTIRGKPRPPIRPGPEDGCPCGCGQGGAEVPSATDGTPHRLRRARVDERSNARV